jgi:hypothetical protein
MRTRTGHGFVLEESPDGGRELVVTGEWSERAADVLRRRLRDTLVLNYTRGFRGQTLAFLSSDLPVRRLLILDRSITDLSPVERLAGPLEEIAIEASASARVDLTVLPQLKLVDGEWSLIGDTVDGVELLEDINTLSYPEEDLHPFSNQFSLKRLVVTDAPHLRSMSGVQFLREMDELRVILAPKLDDIGDVGELADSLLELEFQDCAAIEAIGELEPLVHLRQLGVNNCGRIESLAPLIGMQQLEVFLAWESTRVVDGDLSPLMRLPRLQDVRMRDRREYRPRVAEIKAAIAAR